MRNLWFRLGATRRGHQLEDTELGPEPRSVPQKSLPPNLGHTKVTSLPMHELPCRVDASSRRSNN